MKKRKLLKCSKIFLVAIVLIWVFSVNPVQAFYQSQQIPLFGTTLRGIGPDQIPVAAPDPFPAPVTKVTHYTINIGQFQDQILPIAFGQTLLWGYNPANPLFPGSQKHLGGIIVGKKGVPIQITFNNNLPNASPIPIDTTIPGANQDQNRAAVHFHGGHVPWISDGGPFDWFTPDGTHGLSFLNNVLNPSAGINQAEYYYPLDQSARFGWYHDHAWGITRTNAYAGVASALLIRDDFENGLIKKGLPDYIERGGFEIPLIIQDKIFVGPDIMNADPSWTGPTAPGSLWYAHTYEANQPNGTGRWDLGPILTAYPPDPSVVAEFFGDTMLVNGTSYPQTTVQARRYRLRLLNACNARFLNLQLYIADNSPDGITLDGNGKPTNIPFTNAATGSNSFLQIGTEGGFLAHPVTVPSSQPMIFLPGAIDPNTGQTNPALIQQSLLMAPAERTDVIVDFSSVQPGTNVILYSDAPAPFPSGDDRNDYFPGYNVGDGLFGIGNPVNGTTQPGFGPNTRVLMRFTVVAASGPADPPLKINARTDLTAGNDPLLVPAGSTQPPRKVFKRFLTLNEYFDEYGRLIQIIGDATKPYGSPYVVTASFTPNPPGANVGATEQYVFNGTQEVWEIYNTTGDVHPMHFHLVNVQVINRQQFDESTFPGSIHFTGPVLPADPNEQGYKETVRMYPGTVTRVIMQFTIPLIKDTKGNTITTYNRRGPNISKGSAPLSPRTGGYEYVWHCHILEHEEHDMMHALVVW